MILLPIVALFVGIALPRLMGLPGLPGVYGNYLAVACLAGLDTIFGGVRTGLEGKFNNQVFITGFLSNTLIAFFLAVLGDRIGINMFLVAALVLGTRIFNNLSLIRRYALTRYQDARERQRQQAVAAQAQAQAAQSQPQTNP
ncbi:MAG TPA: small basic family protein [Fimbriimonadaceae bacterium]|nr:small basic family protein [Fimbriimonadaceae bacterium]